jgi:hypothetical protein
MTVNSRLSFFAFGLIVLFSNKIWANPITGPDQQKIKNAFFQVEYDNHRKEMVQFHNGSYSSHDSATDIDYKFEVADKPLLKEDSGQTYVVLWTSKAGTGHWAVVKQVDLSANPARETKSFPTIAEDRIRIDDISIKNSKLILKVTKHRTNDPSCCPTQKSTIEYPLQ